MKNEDEMFELKELQVESLKEAQIDRELLKSIYRDYASNQKILQEQADYLGKTLLHNGELINSVKQRIKDPLRLLAKIVRKRKEAINGKADVKYLDINVDNYKSIINDLVGIRAIYLFRENWKWVNDFILSNFVVCKDEVITIYHSDDNDISLYPEHESVVNEYKYKLDTKKSRYRSTHYIIKGLPPHNFKFELQTRTILDEAWGEIDHHIRYPDFQNDLDLERKMSVLNGAINGCEELTSTYFNYFSEIRAENETNPLAAEEDGLTLMPRDQALELISDSAKVSDGTWDNLILKTALSREKERIAKSKEILKNKKAAEEVYNQQRYLENFLLRGARMNSESSEKLKKNIKVAHYKNMLKDISDQMSDNEDDSE